MNKHYLTQPIALITLSLLPLSTLAGGIWLNEAGDPSQGRAGAGSAAGTDDASAAIHNVSSMTRLDSDQIMVTGGFIYSKVEFNVKSNGLINGDGDGGNAGNTIPVGSAFYTRQINEEIWLGVSMAGWSGSGLDYHDDWTGRYQATDVDILAMVLMPSVAYKINDQLSVGFGLPVMYTRLKLDLAVPTGPGQSDKHASLDGDDTVVAVNFSTLYEFTERTRIGAYYNSKFEADYGGDLEVSDGVNTSAKTNMTLSELIRVSMSHEFNDATTGHLSWGWENWSDMGHVTISVENNGAALPRKWEDTYHYAAGVTHNINQHWRINAGVAYDTNPVDKNDRTADLPIDRQLRYAFGLEHTPTKGPSIAGSLVYADYGSAPIRSDGLNDGNLTGFNGNYKSNDIVFFSLSANWVLGK